MNEENIIIAYKISEDDKKILESVSNKTQIPFTIMTTNKPKDIFPFPTAFMSFVNIENEANEKDKINLLKNIYDIAEDFNIIIINKNTFKNEEKLIKIINKGYTEAYEQTEWYKLVDESNELLEKIKIYQKAHNLQNDDYTFSELDLIKYFNGENISNCIINSIKWEILCNKLQNYIDFNHKHISPISYKSINKCIFQLFLDYNTFSSYPIKYEDEKEQENNPRMIEINQLRNLCDILAEEIYIGKYEKYIGNNKIEFMVKSKKDKNITDEHLIACRLSKDSVFCTLMQYVKEIIITSLSKEYKNLDNKNLFKYKFSNELWETLKKFIKDFANLPLWKSRNLTTNVFKEVTSVKEWKKVFETGITSNGVKVLETPINLVERT